MKFNLSRLTVFNIELFKVSVAVMSLTNISLLSYLYDDGIVVMFVAFLASQIVLSSLFDFGANVINLNTTDNESSSLCFKSINVEVKIKLLSLIFVIPLIYNLAKLPQSSLQSVFMVFCVIIASYFSVFIMRWLTVVRKSGYVKESILFGELLPSFLRLLVVPATLLGGELFLILWLSICPLVVAFVCKRKIHVFNLDFSLFHKNRVSVPFKAYFLSTLISLKNQALSLFITFVPASLQLFVVISSRVMGVISIFSSGLLARLPHAVFRANNGEKAQLVILSSIIFLFSIFLILTKELVYNVGRWVFGGSSLWVELPDIAQLFFVLLLMASGVSFICLLFQCKGMLKRSILVEILYLTIVAVVLFSM